MISYMIHTVPKKTYHFLRGNNTLLGSKSVIHFLYDYTVSIFSSGISLINVIAAVMCTPLKFIGWNPKPHYFWTWLYLEIRPSKRWSSLNGTMWLSLNPVWLVPLGHRHKPFDREEISWAHSKRTIICTLRGEEVPEGIRSADTFVLHFSAPEWWGNRYVV